MLPTQFFSATDLTTDSQQLTEFNNNFAQSTEPEGTFAALMQPATTQTHMSDPWTTGEILPLSGEALPAGEAAIDTLPVTDDLSFYEDGSDPVLFGRQVANAEDRAVVHRRDEAVNLVETASESELAPAPLSIEIAARGDLRQAGDVRRFGERQQIRLASQPSLEPLPRPDTIVYRADAGEIERLPIGATATLTEGAAQGRLPVEPTALNSQNNDLRQNPAAGLRASVETTPDMFVMTETAALRDAADTAIKPSSAGIAGVASTLPDPGALRDVSAAQRNAAVVTTIDRPVIDDAWGEQFQERVLWMTDRRIQSAEIRLNPPEMGPIRVQVSVQDDAAVLNFTAQHSATREAIEQALPRLREMLSENGLSLAGSTVGDARDERADSEARGTAESRAADDENLMSEESDAETVQVVRTDVSGIVDTFV